MDDKSPTVFLVDDDLSVLKATARLLRAAGFSVETFDNPRAFLNEAPRDRAGCAVVDLRMPDIDGIELQAQLVKNGCRLPLVFLTGHGDVPASVKALKAGAVDFLQKPVSKDDLLDAVTRALEADVRLRAARQQQEQLRARWQRLTPREREVCEGIARGLLNKQIASELGTEEQTVRVHRSRLMHKLGVDSVAALVRFLDRLKGD